VQKIVEDTDSDGKAKFFSIKLVRVRKAQKRSVQEEEVMVQIQDISLRV